MNDNIQKEVITLPPFKRFCMTIGELPSSYVETMTYYEMVLWFTKYLSDTIIPTVNNNAEAVTELQNLFVELQSYVNNYFDNLDVQEEINNKLDEMAEDGFFDNIFTKYNLQTGTLLLNVVHRDCSSLVKGITDQTAEDSVKGYIQGIVTTPTSIIYSVNTGGEHQNKSNYSWLIEVSKSTNQIIRERFLNIYHANCIAYNESEDELYITAVSQTNQAGTGQEAINKILILDYKTFETIQEITPPAEVLATGDHIMSVSYDNTTQKLGIGGLYHFWILKDWETVEKTINIDFSLTAPMVNKYNNNKTTNQMIIMKGNRLYQCRYFDNAVNVYGLDGKLINNYYQFKTNIPVTLLEFEGITIEDDGTMYIATCQRTYTINQNFNLYDNVIFKTNIKTGGYNEILIDNVNIHNPNYGITYHVDPNTTNKLQIGTSAYPFKHIQQAMNASIHVNTGIRIQCKTIANYEWFITNNNKDIIIYGNNKATFYGAQIKHQSKISIVESVFDLSHNIELDDDYYNIYNEYSDVEFNNTTFNGGQDIEYAIASFHSNIIFNSCVFEGFTNALFNKNLTTATLVNVTFRSCTYRFLFNGTNKLFYEHDALFTFINPEGVLPKYINNQQMIQYTKTDNNFVFNNNKMLTYLTTQLLYMTIGLVVNNVTYNHVIPFRYTNNNASVEIYANGTLYKVTYQIAKTETGFTITPHVYQTNMSTGTLTDVTSNVTINYYSLMVVNY